MGKRKRCRHQVTKIDDLMGKCQRSGHKVAKADNVADRLAFTDEATIGKVPDEILHSILSSMPVRNAVRTGVLSSRWRHLLTSLPHLNFTGPRVFGVDPFDEYFGNLDLNAKKILLNKRTKIFIRSVNRFLQHHVSMGVESFKIHFSLDKKYACHLDQWINFALTSGTKNLHIKLSERFLLDRTTPELYDFPCQIFVGGRVSSVVHLCLKFCSLRPPPNFDGFNLLRELYMDEVSITERDLHDLIRRCSVLEWLRLRKCRQLTNLKISSTSSRLKCLIIEWCDELKKIDLPSTNIVTFEYRGYKIRFSAMNAPRLVRASMYFEYDNFNCIDYILNGLSSELPHLKTLFLNSHRPFQAALLPRSLNKFTNLKHLVMQVEGAWDVDLLWVASFMNVAPFIEKFQLDILAFSDSEEIAREIVRPPKCLHNSLKEVEISRFVGYINQIELATYILNNAVALELMKINTGYVVYGGNHKWAYHQCLTVEEIKRAHIQASEHLLGEVPPCAKLLLL